MMSEKKLLTIKALPLGISIVLFAVLSSVLCAQTKVDSSLKGKVISKIEILGNNLTKEYIILREMKTKEGDR
ncbi:MAG: hypothetical protein R6V04_06100, partial [bacterium]